VEKRRHIPHHLPRFSRRTAFGWVLASCGALVGWVIASSPAAARDRTNDIVVRLETERQNLVVTTGNLLSRLTGATGGRVANRQISIPNEPAIGIDASEILPGSAPVALPVNAQPCPDGMVLVEGDYCPAVVQSCLETVDGDEDRCAKYSTRTRCIATTEPRRVCVDRYEYPNTPGVKPAAMVSWNEAKATCEAQNKRLCTNREWTLACEGSDHLPYPYGFKRDASACNIDRPYRDVDFEALYDPERSAQEFDRLDQRVASGSLERCTSPYGVFDMTGNVDEWVVNEPSFLAEHPSAHASGLKGGYWGPVRDRCRATTIAHSEGFRFYQIGFRCCSDPAEPGAE
jgi:formylglycine-generating enzyme